VRRVWRHIRSLNRRGVPHFGSLVRWVTGTLSVVRRIVLFGAALLALPATASAAVFTSPPYDGAEVASGAGPFVWKFVSPEPPGTEFGDVGYRVDGGEWHGCLQGPQEVSLSNLASGMYSISIADSYTPAWLGSEGRGSEIGQLCASPDGHGLASDWFTVPLPGPLPPIENTPTPFERSVEAWVGSRAAEGAALEQAKFEEAQEAREAANQPPAPAALPIPKGEWCGKEGVSCGEVTIANASIGVQSDGMALVRLECGGSENCGGKLTLSGKTISNTKRKKVSRTVTIGAAKFSIAAGKTATVRIALGPAGRALLARAHERLAAHLTVLELVPAPEHTQTMSVRLSGHKAQGDAKK
jgi:hypothetical protein